MNDQHLIVFAREPIFTAESRLFAYQLNFRDGVDSAFESMIDDSLKERETSGVIWTELLEGFRSVISLSEVQLLNPIPDGLTPAETIFEIDCVEQSNTALIQRIKELKAFGFKFVCSSKQLPNETTQDLIDFVKVSTSSTSSSTISHWRQSCSNDKLKIIICDVQTQTHFEEYKKLGFDLYQGFFFLTQKTEKPKEIPANRIAVLNLVSQLSKPELDLKNIQNIFEHDATLSYLLFRFINNPTINKSFEIKSIKHALNYLGEMMLRKFVAIVSLTQMNHGNVTELLQVSLVRAKFCEEVAKRNPALNQDELTAFLCGLFSLIDLILHRDMAELLDRVKLQPEINTALLKSEGSLHEMIKICRSLESGHWSFVLESEQKIGMPPQDAQRTFYGAIRWANEFATGASNDFPISRPR